MFYVCMYACMCVCIYLFIFQIKLNSIFTLVWTKMTDRTCKMCIHSLTVGGTYGTAEIELFLVITMRDGERYTYPEVQAQYLSQLHIVSFLIPLRTEVTCITRDVPFRLQFTLHCVSSWYYGEQWLQHHIPSVGSETASVGNMCQK